MSTNPLSYKLPITKGGTVTCHSKSANFQMAIIVFDNNNAIVFTGSGVGASLKTAGGATSANIPASAVPTHVNILFFSHPVISRAPLALAKSVKEPVLTPRPWGNIVNIISQDSSGNDECELTMNLNG